MPRTRIAQASPVEYLSILDDRNNLDQELEPDISTEMLLEMYRTMLFGRRFDERMLNLQRQGRIGTFPPITGQEAAQMGAVFHLQAKDWLVPAFRETAAEIYRGRSPSSVLLYYNGYNEGTIISKEQRDMPMAIPVGSQILHAVGLAYAAKYRGTDEIVMTFFGDGATSEGDFHEGMNCAAVYQSPVVFICQNNHWAISIPLHKQTRTATIAEKAQAYGMPGIQVDGNDILAVYAAVGEACERARNGNGPTLIECVTYRVMMHTTADDPSRYRGEEEVAAWQKRDPLLRFANYLENKGVLDAASRDELEHQVQQEIQETIDSAEQQMNELGDPIDMFDHLYEQLPPSLQRQKKEVEKHLQAENKETGHG